MGHAIIVGIIDCSRPSLCSKCRTVPLCESRCEGTAQHEKECALLRDHCFGRRPEPKRADADLVTLMRAAMLKSHDPGAYEEVMALESNKGQKVILAVSLNHNFRACPFSDEAGQLV